MDDILVMEDIEEIYEVEELPVDKKKSKRGHFPHSDVLSLSSKKTNSTQEFRSMQAPIDVNI
jgi:hypothetical protein